MITFPKLSLLVIVLALSSSTPAQEFKQPLLKASDVIDFVIKHEGLNKTDVKVILLNFDYLNNTWHVELAPVTEPCIDCYPSYYIEDSKDPKIKKIMHG